jgi:hypothetical protein
VNINGNVEILRFVVSRQLREQGLTEGAKLILIRDRTTDLVSVAKKVAQLIRRDAPGKQALEAAYENLMSLCETRGVKAYVQRKVDASVDKRGYRITKDVASVDRWLNGKT